MNPYTLSCVHAGNLGVYRLALIGATKPAQIAMLGKLIRMEVALVAEAEALRSELAQLRSAQRAISRRPKARSGLRLV